MSEWLKEQTWKVCVGVISPRVQIPLSPFKSLTKPMNTANKTFCMAPWTHMHISPDGDVRQCCMMSIIDEEYSLEYLSIFNNSIHDDKKLGSLKYESIQDIWNNDKMKKLRKNMLCGEKSDCCTGCYKQEEIGNDSLRSLFNSQYSNHYKYIKETKEDGTFEKFNLVSWNFELDNVCNFKCRSCVPALSSSWEQELRKKFNIKDQFFKINLEKLYQDMEPLYDIVEDISFAGGEPLISDYHYDILNKLIEKNKTEIYIHYNTNFSTFTHKGIHVFDLWDKFSNIDIQISLDGMGKRGELIRKGFNWEKFLNNIETFKIRFPQQTIKINCVFQVINCFHVMDLHRELYEMEIIKNWDDFNISILLNPNILSVCILDSKYKKNLAEKIKYHITKYLKPAKAKESIKIYTSILKMLGLEDKSHLVPHFKKYMNELDILRNENYLEVFPELKEIFGDIDKFVSE